MIFNSVNEKGEKKIDKIMAMKPGETMVTRRLKPIPVEKMVAAQPNRGARQVCKIRIKACMRHMDWISKLHFDNDGAGHLFRCALEEEAHREGFLSWHGLLAWLKTKGIDVRDTWRMEFEKI